MGERRWQSRRETKPGVVKQELKDATRFKHSRVQNEQWHKAMLYQTPCQNSCSASHLSHNVTSISTYVPILRKTHQNKWRVQGWPLLSGEYSVQNESWSRRKMIGSLAQPDNPTSIKPESDSYFSWGKWESQWCAAQAARHPAQKREKKAHGHDRTMCCSIPKTNKLSFIHIRKLPVPSLGLELTFSRWRCAGFFTVTEVPAPHSDGWVIVKMNKEEKRFITNH